MTHLTSYFELQTGAQKRWLSMEGFRGLAVLLVFFVHYTTLVAPVLDVGEAATAWMTGLREIGNSGVDLFFVLSGFLIYRSVILRPVQPLAYAKRRVERIYPTFLLIFFIYLALSYGLSMVDKLPSGGGAATLYIVQNLLLLPGIFKIDPLVEVAWSLSYEAFYYIVIPLLVGLLAMRRWGRGPRLIFFIALYGLYALLEYMGLAWNYRLSMFIAGIVLFEIAPRTDGLKAGEARTSLDVLALFAFIAALVAFTLLGRSRFVIDGTVLMLLPAFAKFILLSGALIFILYRALFLEGLVTRLFSFSPLRWLGNMSYSYYLAHSLGLHIFFKALEVLAPDLCLSGMGYFALLVPAFLATLGASIPIYLGCERPLSLK